MNWGELLGTVASTLGLTLGAAYWLSKRLIDHRLAKEMSSYKAELDERLINAKAALDERLTLKKVELDAHAAEGKSLLEAALKKDVEDYLGDRGADREYRLDARKPLYTVLGPLRFQLIMASEEFANRINNMGGGSQGYSVSMDGYFGRSTAFRLLRVFGLAELIERQVAHADFSVDPATVDLLRFKTTAFRCLSSSSISLHHPRENWNRQVEHIFYDTLSTIAAAVIVEEGNVHRVMRFDEFSAFVADLDNRRRLEPIPKLLDGFNTTSKPLLWLRLVALAHVCAAFVNAEGPQIGIRPSQLDTVSLLRAAKDEFIETNLGRYTDMLSQTVAASRTTQTATYNSSQSAKATGAKA